MRNAFKRTLPLALLSLALTSPALAADDPLPLPAPSPLARVMQTVGVAEVTVEYSSPGAKGRQIMGGLVPHGELWRTGANAATKITLSHDAKVGGKAVPAGTYAVFTEPGKAGWTVILNKNAAQGGTRSYDKALDAARVQVRPAAIPARERMTFLFANTTDTATRLDLEWETTRISVPIEFDTATLAKGNIEAFQKSASSELAGAARYMADGAKDVDAGLALIDQSIAVHETWFNVWIKADFLHRKGQNKPAYALAQKAWELGNKAEYFFWKAQVKEALDTWKKR